MKLGEAIDRLREQGFDQAAEALDRFRDKNGRRWGWDGHARKLGVADVVFGDEVDNDNER